MADEIYARCSLVIEQNNLKKLLYSLRVQHLEQFSHINMCTHETSLEHTLYFLICGNHDLPFGQQK